MNKKKEENSDSGADASEDKKQSWKSKVKACRQARKAIKGGHATDSEKAYAEENCKMKGGKRRRKNKGGDDGESDDASDSESEDPGSKGKGGKRKRRKNRGNKGKG